jgi:hypothetical protein
VTFDAAVPVLIGLAGILGGWVGGRKNSALAQNTIALMSAQLDIIKQKADQIPALLERIAILESLVTQRADVEAVKEVVNRIEEKLDAATFLVP